ncbi:App1 family protein [Alteraurantiacibacter aestuarii]|uniref:DUF2183 domain-containing protein n=1 Tax=Alteraurantiacibacter aestuarii TaxID=650004 RepID=A0A844ZJ86_9SPHN|nr:phosphatase domain-containing protein [Alteraurantiacibacter aestuarii]MXO88531.1 DUF2183 domain-containing protein [Alteraurantiacibacter aestuarii]
MALFSATPKSSPVRIQPYFGYRSHARLVLKARALRSGQLRSGDHDYSGGGRWLAVRTMLAQFASREVAGVRVTLALQRPDGDLLHHSAHSDAEGFVHFDLALDPHWDLPDHPAWEMVRLSWPDDDGEQSLAGHVLAPGRLSDLAVISDIDDTIIETGITGGIRPLLRNWQRLLAQWPQDRIAVPGTDVFFSALGGGIPETPHGEPDAIRLAASHRPFFYVSSSPWNLFSYLVAFKRAKRLPLGPLMLRDWAMDRATLGGAGHGAHKSASIGHIVEMYPQLRFALIGDDTQGDLPAFADVVDRHPGRIAAIFLRRIATDDLSEAERAAQQMIEQAGVPLWMGPSYDAGLAFLRQAGLDHNIEASRIVAAVGEAAADARPGD